MIQPAKNYPKRLIGGNLLKFISCFSFFIVPFLAQAQDTQIRGFVDFGSKYDAQKEQVNFTLGDNLGCEFLTSKESGRHARD
jgi:hypothetical protein